MGLLTRIKRFLYFPIAYYFRFFAKIQLLIWKPRIIVITGSSGKTTLLHLLESQIQARAEYSHQANSSFGIPFDILGLKRKTLTEVKATVKPGDIILFSPAATSFNLFQNEFDRGRKFNKAVKRIFK